MDLIKNIIKPFLLPPGIFIGLIVSYGSWCLVKKKYLRGFIFLFLGIAAWGLSTLPVSDALLGPLEKGLTIPQDPVGDVIIVLDAGTNSERPDPLGKGGPSQTTLNRIVVGARLSKQLNIPIIFSGMGNRLDAASTSEIVVRYIMDQGVGRSLIFIENKSKNTFENAVFSAVICRSKGFQRPILVTSGYHMKRAVMYFKDEKMNVLPFPSQLGTWSGKKYTWISFLPKDFQRSSLALHEYIGLLNYRYVPPKM